MAEHTAPMGWYDDPTQPGTQRFWTGSAWTDDSRRSAGSAARRVASDVHPFSSADVRDQRFDSSFRGYAEDEVDAFLERAGNSLHHWESGRPGGLTSADIDGVTFKTKLGGLSEEQVDAFLARVAAALRTYEQEPRAGSAGRSYKAARRVEVPVPASGEPITAHEVAEQTFPEERSGYTESKVDDLLHRAAESLEAWELGEAGELASDEAQHARFYIDIHGYSKHEVDEFVGRVVATLRRYEQAGV